MSILLNLGGIALILAGVFCLLGAVVPSFDPGRGSRHGEGERMLMLGAALIVGGIVALVAT